MDLKNEEDIAKFFIEMSKRKDVSPRQAEIELIDAHINYLKAEKRRLEVEDVLDQYPEIREDIKNIFKVYDEFESQKNIYERNKGEK
jgi:hypothetical protein